MFKNIFTQTDMKQTPKKRFSELEQQKNALDQSAMVAITDTSGNITYVNNKFCEVSQYTSQELIGQNHRIINSGLHDNSFFRNLWRTISSGNTWQGEIRNQAKDNSYYWVYTTIVPFLDENGQPYQYVSIRFDITNQKKQELELLHRNEQLADFCSIVSHNLRAPLSNLILLTSMIEKSNNVNEQKELVEMISKPVNLLNETFNELVESIQVLNNPKIQKEELYFQDCFDQVIGTLNVKQLFPEIVIITNFNDASHIIYPKNYLISIFHNLISNAIKYRSPNRTLIVKIATYKANSSIWLKVADNGLGIDLEAYGNKLFGLQKTFHGNEDAKGFGLFMTKTQVQSMGGIIFAESEPDLGSTFYVKF
ncbi:MAG: PAS domain-containing sensor histidine kinase [Allomuricauda sp.]